MPIFLMKHFFLVIVFASILNLLTAKSSFYNIIINSSSELAHEYLISENENCYFNNNQLEAYLFEIQQPSDETSYYCEDFVFQQFTINQSQFQSSDPKIIFDVNSAFIFSSTFVSDSFYFSSESYLNISNSKMLGINLQNNTFELFSHELLFNYSELNAFEFLTFEGNYLNIFNSTVQAGQAFIYSESDMNYIDSELQAYEKISFGDNFLDISYSSVEAGQIFLYSENDIALDHSTLETLHLSCSPEEEHSNIGNFVTWENVESDGGDFKAKQFNDQLNMIYNSKNGEPIDFFLSTNIDLVIRAQKEIRIANISLNSSRIGLYSPNIKSNFSSINSSSKGCPSDSGIGLGAREIILGSDCAGNGGNHGGLGAIGLGNINNITNKSALTCIEWNGFFQNIYDSPFNPVFEGSGGGSYIINEQEGGSGGGVIVIQAIKFVSDNYTIITANGENGANNNGAGSGGTIQIYAKKLKGSPAISSSGGTSVNKNPGGAGGGGRMLIYFYLWMNNLIYSDSSGIYQISVNGGNSGYDKSYIDMFFMASGGSLYTTPCLQGFYGIPCSKCSLGTYKVLIDILPCDSCFNVPKNANPTTENDCSKYSCKDSIWFVTDINEQCLESFPYYISIFFKYSRWIITIVAILWGLNFGAYVWRTDSLKNFCGKGSDSQKLKASGFNYEVKDNMLQLCQRIYLSGVNTYKNPWYLPTDASATYIKHISMRKGFSRNDYEELSRNINAQCKWRKTRKFFVKVSKIIYYPFYVFMKNYYKKAQPKKLQKYLKQLNNEIKAQGFYLTARISRDQTLCALDLMSESYEVDTSHQSIFIMFSGDGTFLTPFQINMSDPYLQLLPLKIITDDQMNDESFSREELVNKCTEFLSFLNFLLRKIEREDSLKQVIRDFELVCDYVNFCKKHYFEANNVQLDLVCLINPTFTQYKIAKSTPASFNFLRKSDWAGVVKLLEIYHSNMFHTAKADFKFGVLFYHNFDAITLQNQQPNLDNLVIEKETVELQGDDNQLSLERDIKKLKNQLMKKYNLYVKKKKHNALYERNDDGMTYYMIKSKFNHKFLSCWRNLLYFINSKYLLSFTIGAYLIYSLLLVMLHFINYFYLAVLIYTIANNSHEPVIFKVLMLFPFPFIDFTLSFQSLYWLITLDSQVGRYFIFSNMLSLAVVLFNLFIQLCYFAHESINGVDMDYSIFILPLIVVIARIANGRLTKAVINNVDLQKQNITLTLSYNYQCFELIQKYKNKNSFQHKIQLCKNPSQYKCVTNQHQQRIIVNESSLIFQKGISFKTYQGINFQWCDFQGNILNLGEYKFE